MASLTYNSNPNLKSIGISVDYTEHQIQEYIKCKADPIYFIKNYIKIITLDYGLVSFELYDYQIDFINTIHNNSRSIGMFPRQHGKTTTVAAYLVWYCVFNESKNVAMLGNKVAAAREVMARFQLMYEELPVWLQQGVVEWNKGSIALENKSKAFIAATTASGIRGKTCVSGDTKICIEDNDNIYYTEIRKFINNSNFIELEETIMKYSIYKTTNKINNKFYIGFHKTTEENIISLISVYGSIYEDGYLGSGKLIKKAIEKYGPENFYQELIGLYNTKEEAERVERLLVNKDFVIDESNYNISVGGNVAILYGKDNGFFGKKHTKETLDKIQYTRNKNGLPTYQFKLRNVESGDVYYGIKDIISKLDIKIENPSVNFKNKIKLVISKMCYENLIEILNEDTHRKYVDNYQQYLDWVSNESLRSEYKSQLVSKRFLDVSKTEEHKKNIGIGISDWIKNNPIKHKLRMDKINKDPEKIKKTAEKHRGMKRSDETRRNISIAAMGRPSAVKGKIPAKHKETGKRKYFNSIDDIPGEWTTDCSRGPSGKKSFTNGIEYKLYVPGTEPEGWILGGKPKKK